MFVPISKHQRTIRSSFILLIFALNISIFVEGKNLPAETHTTKDEATKDPLVALPSEGPKMNIEPATASAQPQSEQNHSYHISLSALSRQGEYGGPQQQHAPPQAQQDQSNYSNEQEGYYLVKPDGTVIQHVPAQASEGPNGGGRQEYISLIPMQQQQQQQQLQQASGEPRREYPGEILYVDPNGDYAKPLNESTQGRTQDQGSNDYSHVAGAISRISGLPATILTEVPIKEMPLDVLEKLRKDYGVRIVATREHPGANLVINCDEYSNQDNSICLRQIAQAAPQVQHLQTFNHEKPSQPILQHKPQQPEPIQHTTLVHYSPYSITSVDEHASDGQHASEQPRTPSDGLTAANYVSSAAEAVEPPQGFYETRDGEARVINQDEAANLQEFGSKRQTQTENAYQREPENQSEQVGPANDSKEDHESENLSHDFQ